MEKDKVFFSYSRSDSDFALKLAQDLRNNGVQLWIDQLDIKGGSRWDSSIEAALNSAGTVLVILTPTSISSNNVMDEVSFALENNKSVIPILLISCAIPFRLRRLQYVDFTKDYTKGFNQLREVLIGQKDFNTDYNYNKEHAKGDSSHLNIEKTDIKNKDTRQIENPSLRKYLFYGVSIISLFSVVFLAMGKWHKFVETNNWQTAAQKNDSASYVMFIEKFPDSEYLNTAKYKLDSLRRSGTYLMDSGANTDKPLTEPVNGLANVYSQDSDAWAKAVVGDNLSQYQEYYRKFPSGLHSLEAKRIIGYKEQLIKTQNQNNEEYKTDKKNVEQALVVKKTDSYSISFKLSVPNPTDARLALQSCDIYVDGQYATSLNFKKDGIGLTSGNVKLKSGVHRFTAREAVPKYYQNGENGDMLDTFNDLDIKDNTVVSIRVEIFKPAQDWVWTPRWINFDID